MQRVIDTHAHLDELDAVDLALRQASEQGVVAVVGVGSSRESNERIAEICARYSAVAYPAFGLHPSNLPGLMSRDLDANLGYLDDNIDSAVAMGEIGLDYSKGLVQTVSKQWQRDVLGSLLDIARRHDKPVVIHSRYAWQDAFELVSSAGLARAVFHWFTGFSSVLRKILEAGYLVSATPAVEYHEEHRRAIRAASDWHLMLETDSPVSYGRENRYRARPRDVLRTLKAVALLRETPDEVVADTTTATATRFFGLPIEY